jgi:hypothetical protein
VDALMPLVEAHVAAKVAEAKAEALREAARRVGDSLSFEKWLRDRADAIEDGAS